MPLAPAFALAAAFGGERIVAASRLKAKRTQNHLKHRVLVGLMVVSVLLGGLAIRPQPYSQKVLCFQETSTWLAREYPDSQIVATNVWFFYFHDLAWTPERIWTWRPSNLDIFDPETIIVWDKDTSDRRRFHYDDLVSPIGDWEELTSCGEQRFVVVFQKQ